MYKPKKEWIMQILAQCPHCGAVKFVKNKKDDIGWQLSIAFFPNKPVEMCPSCAFKKSKT